MPTYLKRDESVRGGLTLPIPPTHKNTTQQYLHNKKQTTPAICSRRCHHCRCHRCHPRRCRRLRRHCRVLHQEPPPLSASVPIIPFASAVADVVAAIVPVAHVMAHIITLFVTHRCLPSTPTIFAQVIAHRHHCHSPPPPSNISRR
jgi:hypothetical protein